jgi:pectin methylesterase-like acyl-CoA thioesterase
MEVCNRLVKVCVLSLLLWSAFAFAAELYVPSDAYRTIQAAINAANSGDTIIVAAGTYRENLNITKSITIRGVDKDSVILEPTVAGYGIGIAGAGNSVTIENITIKAGSAKFFMVHVYGISSFTIQNVKIEGTGKTVTIGCRAFGRP